MFKNLIIFLPFLVCLFWLVTFAFRFRSNDGSRRMLTLFLAVCTVLYLCHALYFSNVANPLLESLWALCSLSVYPLYYLYIHVLTVGSSERNAPWWILAPGAVIAVCIFLLPGAATDFARKVLFFIQIIAVLWYGIVRLRNFDREVASIYADTEGRSVSDIRTLLIAFVLTSFLSAGANAIGKQFFNENDALLYVVACLFAMMLYVLSFIGFSRDFSYDVMAEDIPEDDHETHALPDEALGRAIESLMNDQKLYLRKGLKIGDVVQLAGSCRTYVSNYINQTKNMSFSDYVNSLRVEHAKKALLSEEVVKFVILADNLGFASEQSFYRNFKKFTGMTPAQWKKSQPAGTE